MDARDMLQISDGANIVEVSKTNIIFTNTTPVEFLYRYSPVGGFSSETTNAKLHTNGLNAGDVIASVTAPEVYTDADGVVWVKRVITPKPIPEAGTREQSFYVVDADGLGREIRLVAHVPYDYSDIEVYPGSENGRHDIGCRTGHCQSPFRSAFLQSISTFPPVCPRRCSL